MKPVLRATEGRLASFDGAAGWLNSPALTTEGLRGSVVVVDFWTYTCINWLRTLAWVRAWDERYRERGLVTIGVHTPEFPFERNEDNVRRAVASMDVRYPVALDPDYAVWQAFANTYWPALYLADADGRIRYQHFGEGAHEETERAIQQLLDVEGDLVEVEPHGFELPADWANLRTPETYLGWQQGESFASPGDVAVDQPRTYHAPDRLPLNTWALTGSWTVASRACVVKAAGAAITFRFRARDVHLVMGPPEPGASLPFRVRLNGKPPSGHHGLDVDAGGRGMLAEQRLHQLIRRHGPIDDATFEIVFDAPGAEAYCFTFG